MSRFNFPTRLPRNSVVGIDAFPSNLITDTRNFHTEISFERYSFSSVVEGPFGTAAGAIGDVVGRAAETTGQLLEGLGAAAQLFTGRTDVNNIVGYTPDSSFIRLPIPRKLNENLTLSWNEISYTDLISNFGSTPLSPSPLRLARDIAVLSGPITGVTPNPFLFVYFDRPNFKRYSFTWTLAARNESESLKIKNIVNKLKERASPTVNPLVMRYPDIVNIKFLPNEIFGMLKIKKCIIEAVSVDYTPAGPSFFNSTAPTLVNLTLNLKEIQLWSQQDYTAAEFGELSPEQRTQLEQFDISTGDASQVGTPSEFEGL